MTVKKKGKSKPNFVCFSCKEEQPRKYIRRSGKYKDGKVWHLCGRCHRDYMRNRKRDVGDVRVGEKGSEKMGWNGVPSDKSLRRRTH